MEWDQWVVQGIEIKGVFNILRLVNSQINKR